MTNTFNKTWLILALLVNGAAIMVLEILGTRIIAPYYGTTLYVWTALIVITLLALALGYYFGGRLADRKPNWKIFYSLFFIVCILFLLIPLVDTFFLELTSNLGIMWGPLVTALLLFFLPLVVMGMVAPIAVRLRTKAVEQVGRTVGNLYAISTAGSIVGALAVAYCLIPNFKISVILFGSAGVLFLVSVIWFIFNKKGAIATISVLLVGVLLVIIQPTEKAEANILEQQKSFYANITVEILSTDLICLTVNSIPQSCFNPDADELGFPYTKLMVRGLEQIEDPQKVLVIGDGGGLISREILKNYPDIMIDAVDIDEKIFELGKKYLYFEDSPHINKIVADGRNFLRNSGGDYDAIFIDAFNGSTPVLHLYVKEMFELAKEKMAPDGVLALNIFGFNRGEGSEVLTSIYKTLGSVFDDVYVSPIGDANDEERDFYSYVPFASARKLDRIGRVFEPEVTASTSIITDDYNPLEYFSLPGSEELINWYVFGIDD